MLDADLAGDPAAVVAAVSQRLQTAGVPPGLSAALIGAVRQDHDAGKGLLVALQTRGAEAAVNPREQALWMLLADFLSAAIPILPFVLLPIPQARIVSAAITVILLVALGVGRARIGGRSVAHTVLETVSIGVTAALAGVAIGTLIDRCYSG
jgi:vacuolar iron transporter family protein